MHRTINAICRFDMVSSINLKETFKGQYTIITIPDKFAKKFEMICNENSIFYVCISSDFSEVWYGIESKTYTFVKLLIEPLEWLIEC